MENVQANGKLFEDDFHWLQGIVNAESVLVLRSIQVPPMYSWTQSSSQCDAKEGEVRDIQDIFYFWSPRTWGFDTMKP